MNTKVYFENEYQEIPAAAINELTFSSSIYNILPTAKLVLKNAALQLFNMVKTGSIFCICFYEDERQWKNIMRVTSYGKIPGKQSNFSDTLEVFLTHQAFFQDASRSKAWHAPGAQDGTISEIISEVVNTDFKGMFQGVSLDITGDRPAVRYQLYEKSLDFLNRISVYAWKENLPVYFFSDATNTLKLKCVSNLMTDNISSSLVAPDASFTNTLPADSKNNRNLILKNFKFGADTSTSSCNIINLFTTHHFRSVTDIASKSKLSGSEAYSIQTESPTPSKTVVYDWSYTPADALAVATKESFEKNSTAFTLSANLDGVLPFKTAPGTLLRVILPYQPVPNPINGKKINLGEGKYVVEKQLLSIRNGIETTKLKLVFVASEQQK